MNEFAHAYPPVRRRVGRASARRFRARAHARPDVAVLFAEPTTGPRPVSARRIDKLIRELSDEST